MELDIRTIVAMLAFSAVLMTVTLLVGSRLGRGNGLARWNCGLGLFALGWVLFAGRGTLPDIVTIAFADGLLLAGLALQYGALAEFNGRRVPGWLLLAPGPLLFFALAPLTDRYDLLTLVSSSAYALALIGIVAAALRAGGEAGGGRWMLAAGYAVGAVLLLVRAAEVFLQPERYPNAFVRSPVQTVSFLALFALTITASLAFMLMQRERVEGRLRELAMRDALTGLLNRRSFFELAEAEFAKAARAGQPLAALMLDLDHFKQVNDRLGHSAGDRALAGFAAIVRRELRGGDIAGRYGGEEFCVLLPATELEGALNVAQRIRQAAAGSLGCTVSVGLAMLEASSTLDALVAAADAALYQAKRSGRDRVCVGPAATPASVRRSTSLQIA